MYCSFNNIHFDEIPEGYEICHLDKISYNDIIWNLQMLKRNHSHQLVYVNKGLSNTQKKQYKKRTDDIDKLDSRICTICGIDKAINEYYSSNKANRSMCKDCLRKRCEKRYYSRKLIKQMQ